MKLYLSIVNSHQPNVLKMTKLSILSDAKLFLSSNVVIITLF